MSLNRLLDTAAAAVTHADTVIAKDKADYDAGYIVAHKCRVAAKPQLVAYDTRTEKPHLYEGQPITWAAFKRLHNIARKEPSNKGEARSKQMRPGDSVNMTRRNIVDWELGNRIAYKIDPLKEHPGFVRSGSKELEPVSNPLPSSVQGQNAMLRALNHHLICDDQTYQRIVAGQRKLAEWRERDHASMSTAAFKQMWCGEVAEEREVFPTRTVQRDNTGPAKAKRLPALKAQPFVPGGLIRSSRPAYVPLPAPAGYEWRAGQLEVHAAVMSGDDVLAILPTGYGKTMAFAAGLAWGANAGMTVIVVPTNVLKMDLVERLQEMHRGLAITYVGNGRKGDDIASRIAGLCAGNYDVLVCSPEHLVPGNQVFAALMSCKIGRFIFDEAHTYLTWTFRKSHAAMFYALDMAFEGIQRCGFTATLEPRHERALMKRLNARSDFLLFRGAVERGNIQLDVMQQGYTQHEAVRTTLGTLRGKTIVMCQTVAIAQSYQRMFKVRSRAYFSGGGTNSMTKKEKDAVLKWFRETPDAILFATKAVGLGVDIQNVKTVIITYVPESVLELVQMIGRAGRDGSPARAVLMYTEAALKAAPNKLAEIYTADNKWQRIADLI